MALLSGNAQKIAAVAVLGFLAYQVAKQGSHFLNPGSMGPRWKMARPSGVMSSAYDRNDRVTEQSLGASRQRRDENAYGGDGSW